MGWPSVESGADAALLHAAKSNPDVFIPFVMVDPWRDDAGVAQARRFIDAGARAFKLHPPTQGFYAHDKHAVRAVRVHRGCEVLHARIVQYDHPMTISDRGMQDFDAAGFRDEVKPLLLNENAARLLGLRHAE